MLKIIEYDGRDDGSQYNWLLHNQYTIENGYQIDFGKPGPEILHLVAATKPSWICLFWLIQKEN